MQALMLLCIFTALPGDDLDLTRGAILDVLEASQFGVHDFEFRYEGHFRRLQPPDGSGMPKPLLDAAKRNASQEVDLNFQGTFAYRNDGSAHVDVYEKPLTPNGSTRRIITNLFKNKVAKRHIVPDKGGSIAADRSESGGVLALKGAPSGSWLTMAIVLRDNLQNNNLQFQFIGWETLGDSRCAVVSFFATDSGGERRLFEKKYWLDMAKGAQVVKFEDFDEGNLASRFDNIKLMNFITEDGGRMWFPVSATSHVFRSGPLKFSDTPVTERTFFLLAGTLAVNRNLKDDRFSLDWKVPPQDRPAKNARSQGPRRNADRNTDASLAKLVDEASHLDEVVAAPNTWSDWFSNNGLVLGLFIGGTITLLLARRMRGHS
ncbi:MAG: hypothetical protein U0835_18445 [Isosphaeraceae bacterium]